MDHLRDDNEPSLVSMAELFEQIREAQHFIVLLATPRHRSPLVIDALTAHVSCWEAELFYALLLLKKTHVFEVTGFNPESALIPVLDIVRGAVPQEQWIRVRNLDALPGEIERVIRAIALYGAPPLQPPHRSFK